MKKVKYQFRNDWKNPQIICWGISEERLDEDYDEVQFGGTFDDFDTFDPDFTEEL